MRPGWSGPYLAAANFALACAWAACAWSLCTHSTGAACDFDAVHARVTAAVALSALEFVHAATGLTRSRPSSTALFVAARALVALIVAPALGCTLAYRATVLTWGAGEATRFGCFGLDALWPSRRIIKSVRYTCGPVFFSIGTAGELILLAQAARAPSPPFPATVLWGLVCAWPFGFAPLLRGLLAQRRKHFARHED